MPRMPRSTHALQTAITDQITTLRRQVDTAAQTASAGPDGVRRSPTGAAPQAPASVSEAAEEIVARLVQRISRLESVRDWIDDDHELATSLIPLSATRWRLPCDASAASMSSSILPYSSPGGCSLCLRRRTISSTCSTRSCAARSVRLLPVAPIGLGPAGDLCWCVPTDSAGIQRSYSVGGSARANDSHELRRLLGQNSLENVMGGSAKGCICTE